MNSHELEFNGVKIDVEGHYYKGSWGSWEEPPEPSEFEIENVYINEINVNELFDAAGFWNDLENIILEKFYDEEN